MEKISVVVSCYNEEESIPLFYNEIKKVMEIMKEFQFEVLFVDDGSKDRTLEVAKELAKKDVRITELDEAVGQLSGKVENLTSVNTQQQEVLESQDKALNMVFYVFGTNKELKDEKIVKGGGLFSSKKIMDGDFNKAYFTKISGVWVVTWSLK